MKKNLILYFGSFNPIHRGHLELIKSVIYNESIECDEFLLIISPQSPEKLDSEIYLTEKERYRLCNISIDDELLGEKVRVSKVEFDLPKPNYTINTLKKLREDYPSEDWNISLLMGQDNLEKIHTWKNSGEILRDYKLIVYPRGANQLNSSHENLTILSNVKLLDISSTQLRKLSKIELERSMWLTNSARLYLSKGLNVDSRFGICYPRISKYTEGLRLSTLHRVYLHGSLGNKLNYDIAVYSNSAVDKLVEPNAVNRMIIYDENLENKYECISVNFGVLSTCSKRYTALIVEKDDIESVILYINSMKKYSVVFKQFYSYSIDPFIKEIVNQLNNVISND